MPLPLVLIGVAAISGGTGIISGCGGAKKIHEAKKIIANAQCDYDKKKEMLDKKEKMAIEHLDLLGNQKLEVWKSFKRFSDAFEMIKNRPIFEENKDEKFSITKHELDEVECISVTAIEVLGKTVLTAGTGALAGLAAYGGTMTLGIASTGTPISALCGAAATKATLAALGGGSLATGGGGIALGTTILGAMSAGPAIAVAGLLLNSKGNSSLRKAEEARSEVNKVIIKMNEAISFLNKLIKVCVNLRLRIKELFTLYEKQVSVLEYLVSKQTDYNLYSADEKKVIENNIILVKLLKNITQIDLIKKDNEISIIQEELIEKELNNSKEIKNQLSA
ncbi:UNVERIFIED_CONTAM: hypothetical protein Cloal_2185 [Acetivibrio alkalicellulosi]